MAKINEYEVTMGVNEAAEILEEYVSYYREIPNEKEFEAILVAFEALKEKADSA